MSNKRNKNSRKKQNRINAANKIYKKVNRDGLSAKQQANVNKQNKRIETGEYGTPYAVGIQIPVDFLTKGGNFPLLEQSNGKISIHVVKKTTKQTDVYGDFYQIDTDSLDTRQLTIDAKGLGQVVTLLVNDLTKAGLVPFSIVSAKTGEVFIGAKVKGVEVKYDDYVDLVSGKVMMDKDSKDELPSNVPVYTPSFGGNVVQI